MMAMLDTVLGVAGMFLVSAIFCIFAVFIYLVYEPKDKDHF